MSAPAPGRPRVRDITPAELDRLVEAAAAIPKAEGDYMEEDYLTNVLITVLDLQMQTSVVNRSIHHYREQRRDEIRTLKDLQALLARHPDDQDGNRDVAQYLWGTNHWKRVVWLRGLVVFLDAENLTSMDALKAWAARSEFHRDFEGRAKFLGIAAYQSLVMRLGIDTVKPDVHIHRFVAAAVGHRVSDAEAVRGVGEAAARLGIGARDLDWAIWEYQRGGAVVD